MPNFDARIRRDYRDVTGLVLDLNRTGIESDPVTGKVARWRNTAPSVVSSIPSWPRYLNAVQPDVAAQGVLGSTGGVPHVAFDSAAGQHMSIDMVGDFGFASSALAVAYELDALGGATAVNQSVLGTDELDLYAIGTPNTTRGYRMDALTDFDAGVSPGDTVTVYRGEPGLGFTRWQNGFINGGGLQSPVALGDASLNPVATLAGNNAGGGFFDGNIRNVRLWNRELQTDEVKFIFQSLASDPSVDYSTLPLATISTRVWDDVTSAPPRVNPTQRAAHLFMLATIPIGGTGDIHLEATIDGAVLPDSALGGDLFDVTSIETPNGVFPLAGPIAVGWSALHFVRLEAVGHYTLEMRRTNGGAIIFHIDVVEA